MTNKIIVAGFGGQGIILTGMILAQGAMAEGHLVSHFPSYGVEMRGGTCNCSVVVSDELIPSPIVSEADIILVFNQPSKLKFESKCKKGGAIFINKSLITEKVNRDDVTPYYIDATNIANDIGNIKAANMVMLGSFIKATGLIKLDTMLEEMPKLISSRNKSLVELNIKALTEGYNLL